MCSELLYWPHILNSRFTLESVYEFRVTYIPALKLTLHPVWLIDFHCVKNLLCLRGYSQFYCTSIPGLWSIDWTDVYRWLVRAAEIFFVVWIWWNGIFANIVNDLSMNFGRGILIYYSIWSYNWLLKDDRKKLIISYFGLIAIYFCTLYFSFRDGR